MSGLSIPQLPPAAVAARLAEAAPPRLIDVREPWEWALARIPGAELIPLGTLPGALAALDPAAPLVVYCHHGVRSQHACMYLAGQGFTDLANLAGGIDAWSDFDPGVPRY